MLKTIWDNSDGCAKEYHFSPAVYLLSCPSLEFFIIIDRAFGAPAHVNYVVDGLNAREKLMPKLSMADLLNTKISCDDIIFYKVMQVHENEVY